MAIFERWDDAKATLGGAPQGHGTLREKARPISRTAGRARARVMPAARRASRIVR